VVQLFCLRLKLNRWSESLRSANGTAKLESTMTRAAGKQELEREGALDTTEWMSRGLDVFRLFAGSVIIERPARSDLNARAFSK
jgi:hypothetical protein